MGRINKKYGYVKNRYTNIKYFDIESNYRSNYRILTTEIDNQLNEDNEHPRILLFDVKVEEYKSMEKYIWKENHDNDLFNEDIKYKIITIENANYILGYCILSVRYFKKNSLQKIYPSKIDNTLEKAIDIEDLVILNTRTAYNYLKEFENTIKEFIEEENPNFIVANFNNYSKPLEKRIRKLCPNKEIKYYNYPSFKPTGYIEVKENIESKETKKEKKLILNYFYNYYTFFQRNYFNKTDLCFRDGNIENILSDEKTKELNNILLKNTKITLIDRLAISEVMSSLYSSILTEDIFKFNNTFKLIIEYDLYLPEDVKNTSIFMKYKINNL